MVSFLAQAGYAALMLFGFLEACCVPISSEITFGFAGVLAYQGRLNLALVIIAGTVAELAGSYVSWGAGRVGERRVIARVGRYLLVTRADMDRAERFLTGRGAWAIPLGRTLPLVRSYTSVVAGFAQVPPVRFGVLSLIGTVIYATVTASIGYAVGPAWNQVYHELSVTGWILAALAVAAIAGFAIVRVRALRHEARADAEAMRRDALAAGEPDR